LSELKGFRLTFPANVSQRNDDWCGGEQQKGNSLH